MASTTSDSPTSPPHSTPTPDASVDGAGDVNGDGFTDMIIGAPTALSSALRFAGESYVVFGRASEFGASFDFATLDGSNGFRLDGLDGGDRSGSLRRLGRRRQRRRFRQTSSSALPVLTPVATTTPARVMWCSAKPPGSRPASILRALDGTNGFRLDGIDV